MSLLAGTLDAPLDTVRYVTDDYQVSGLAAGTIVVSPGIPTLLDRAANVTLVQGGSATAFGRILPTGGSSYTLEARLPDLSNPADPATLTANRLRAAGTDYPPGLLATYTSIEPGTVGPETRALLAQILAAAKPSNPYDTAREKDARCVSAICDLDVDRMKAEEACGKTGVLTLLSLARSKGWKATLLDYRNSGDTSGDKSHGVVGYAAIAFYAPAQGNFNPTEREQLLKLARRALKEAVAPDRSPLADTNNWPAKFREPRGCFVTLTEAGALRGCIGHIFPQESLYRAIQDNARSAALEDPRFRPVQPEELNQLEIEISVLTEPKPLPFTSPEDLLAKLQPGKDGVVLKLGSRGATYLPQVWEQLPDKVEFLNRLSEKAGCAPGDWRGKDVSVSIYHVEAFKESEK